MKAAMINSREISAHRFRFEGSHYLNDYAYRSLQLEREKDKCVPLADVALCFNPPVFKRQFCKDTENAVQYFQSSDVPSLEEKSKVFVYKGQAESLNLLVHKNDILVTGFGTIGNTRLVSRHQEGVCYANNVCRIRATGMASGMIYAFMSSKYGIAQLNNNASGSVVRYIEAPGIKRTLIPQFPDSFQKEVDDLMQESARLREEAMDAFYESVKSIEAFFPSFPKDKFSAKISSKEIFNSFNKRFDANYYTTQGSNIEAYIKENFSWKYLGDVCESITRPDIFKRYYVKNGVDFLGGADIFLFKPDSEKKLSASKTTNLESLMIKEGTILLPRSGTIGQVALAHAEHAQKLASEDVIRLIPNNILKPGYVYAFLASSIGEKLIQKYIFGSVIQHVEPPHLKQIPVPVVNEGTMANIHDNVKTYSSKISLAIRKEKQAISMVEQEIERWNK